MAQKWKKTVNPHFIAGMIAWNLEGPNDNETSGGADIIFRGWILHSARIEGAILRMNGEVLAKNTGLRARPDVAKAYDHEKLDKTSLLNCGFWFRVPYQEKRYQLSILFGDTEIPLVEMERVTEPVSVLEGAHQYLFLNNDSNNSVDQYTGQMDFPEHSLTGWQQNFEKIKEWERLYSMKSAFLIAPAKEEILPQFYPHKRGQTTILDTFLKTISAQDIVLPLHRLKRQSSLAYSRTDTHWTDVGAGIAADSVLKYWNMDDNALQACLQTFKSREFIGDLSAKLSPMRSEFIMAFASDLQPQFTNDIHNNGNIQIYETAHAPIQETCVIFGDSFGVNFAKALAPAFRRLVYLYRPAALDASIIQMERPAYVVLQINQRFLVGLPDFRKTIFETAVEKLAVMPEEKANAILSTWKEALASNNAHIAQSLISAYEARR